MRKYKWYHTTKQHRSFDCGITCVLNILRYFGKHVSRSDFKALLSDAKVKKDGASMWDLINVITEHGLKAEGAKCDVVTLSGGDYCPVILMVEIVPGNHHYIVVYEISNSEIIIADPLIWKSRVAKISMSQFARRYRWHGETILVFEHNQ